MLDGHASSDGSDADKGAQRLTPNEIRVVEGGVEMVSELRASESVEKSLPSARRMSQPFAVSTVP